MSYFGEIYPRIYDLVCHPFSWLVYLSIVAIVGMIIMIMQDSENPYKKRILYSYIIFLASSSFIKLALWVLLPSPEYLGLVK